MESEADAATAYRSAAAEELSSKRLLYATIRQNVSDAPRDSGKECFGEHSGGVRREGILVGASPVAAPWRMQSYEF